MRLLRRYWWLMRSKHFSMSPSNIHVSVLPLTIHPAIFCRASWTLLPRRKPWLWAKNVASWAGSRAYFNRHWYALSPRVGICRLLWVPSGLGMFIFLNPWCSHFSPFWWRASASFSLSCGLSDFCPSIPAVRFPLFNWVTCRTARNIADLLRIRNLCSFLAPAYLIWHFDRYGFEGGIDSFGISSTVVSDPPRSNRRIVRS